MTDGWKVLSLHHVAVAHGDEPICEDFFASMLGSPAHSEEGPGFVERMYPAGGAFLQTLEATGDGVVQRSLDKRGPGLHHVALRVDALDAALIDLRERGVRLIDEVARPGGMGTSVAFLHPSAAGGVLVELVQDPEGGDPTHG
jgi:methylmalonyl-CoA/ethylmalonyl-CoA epimerase